MGSFDCSSSHQAKIYLRGDKDFCSIAADRKLALIGSVNIPPNDARSVAFPIVPNRIGEIEIEVSLILQIKYADSYRNFAGDVVRRRLLVVVRLRTNICPLPLQWDLIGCLSKERNSSNSFFTIGRFTWSVVVLCRYQRDPIKSQTLPSLLKSNNTLERPN